MIRKVRVENYKSISDLTLEPGRVTVLIGANGSGKSNILEAIALASAAAQNKLDNEFLSSRGIRVTETRFMRSAFAVRREPIRMSGVWQAKAVQVPFTFELSADETSSYPKWTQNLGPVKEGLLHFLSKALEGMEKLVSGIQIQSSEIRRNF